MNLAEEEEAVSRAAAARASARDSRAATDAGDCRKGCCRLDSGGGAARRVVSASVNTGVRAFGGVESGVCSA